MTAFIKKCHKRTSHALFLPFWKRLLQSVTNRERFTNTKIIITKCPKNLLQSVIGGYYKVWQVL